MGKLQISKIPGLNTLVIRQADDTFFVSNRDSIVISVQTLSWIISFLIKEGFMSYRVLEGILEEYHTDKGRIKYDDTSSEGD
jgi:hypothetical protein